ncbi:hypothetical protein QN277_003318 [Acacia crassicarpa]|uniref:BTB domain-containing protein n=1 Tax=Acacia crassicarpa TaxID=499986 RepID=A0AAE1MFC1_9FABA|nr:hypothetical protein QN277_003318 [Acacia crassicarpa]
MEDQNLIPLPPPPFPVSASTSLACELMFVNNLTPTGCSYVSTATRDLWDHLFDEAYKADVFINTRNGGILFAHSNVLGMASPVLKGMLKQASPRRGQRSISILGVPHDAVRVFVRFLYSSCYEEEEMKELVLPLLVLSHAFVVPHLNRECEEKLETSLLTIDNLVDVIQLALLCDATRLTLICYRMISSNLKPVSESQGWKARNEAESPISGNPTS